MKKKIILLFSVALLLGMLQSSCWNKGKYTVSYLKIDGVDFYFEDAHNNIDEYADSVNYEDLILNCYSMTSHKETARILNPPNLFINKSYADQIGPQLTGQIESIYIISNEKYNDDYLKGDTLNSIIQVVSAYGNDSAEYETGNSTLSNFTKSHPNSTHELHMELTASPDSARAHKFTIYYKEVNGNVFTDTTQTITITP